MKQNIYDDSKFFNEYQTMRESNINDNELIEIPTMKKMLPNLKDKTILDLGCGAGYMSRYFVENGASKVVACDISQNMIDLASKEDCKNIDYKVLPMEDISSINEKFDIVFSSLAFHYIKDFDKLISDISKLLKPNGMLVFSQENPVATAIIHPQTKQKYVEIDEKRYYLLSDYNNVGKRIIDWCDSEVIKYHRNFETIVNTLIKNNFEIKEIKEPSANEDAIKLMPKLKYQNDRPYFLFVKAIKK